MNIMAGSLIGTGISYIIFTLGVSFIMANRYRTNRTFDAMDMLIMGGIVAALYIGVGVAILITTPR